MSEDEGFLQRWSRRKQGITRDDEEPSEADPDQVSPAAEVRPEEPDPTVAAEAAAETDSEPEPEPPGDEDMPPLESIDKSGNVAAFFSPRVSEGLRQAALRRLFRQPKYNVVDMLDDYAEDYSKPVAMGNILTSDMRYRAEQARKRLEAKLKESLAENNDGPEGPEDAAGQPDAVASTAEPETTDTEEGVAESSESMAQVEDSQVEDSQVEDSDPDSRPV